MDNNAQKHSNSAAPPRPSVAAFQQPEAFFQAMIEYRRKTERGFSVLQACKRLRKVSPALISLIVKGKRKITWDRADELAKLMALTPAEKGYFKNWIANESSAAERGPSTETHRQNRKEFSPTLLNDWLNVYVKDAFRLQKIQKNPKLIYQELAALASAKRIDKSLEFLMREGYIRKTLDGDLVLETQLHTQENPPPSLKVRSFHKAALALAKQNMDIYSPAERFANTLVMDLDESRYQQLIEMISEFSQNLQSFASSAEASGDRLYQLIINLTPTGGRQV